MIQAERTFACVIEHALHARQAAQQLRDVADQLGSRDVDVSDLMIGNCESVRCTRIELFAPELLAHAQPAGLDATPD